MNTFIAFLRGINVSGQKIIKMDVLTALFESIGFTQVRTYIQSGNIIFRTEQNESIKLVKLIEDKIKSAFGFEVTTFLLNEKKLFAITDEHPFQSDNPAHNKSYIVITRNLPADFPECPFSSPNGDVTVLKRSGNAVYAISNEVNGKNGFPNIFIEKKFKIQTTTRNLNTMNKLAEIIRKDYQ